MSKAKELGCLIQEIQNWMKTYSPSKLLKWIQITSIHPSNQIYQCRFELLLAILLSIKIEQFKDGELSYIEFKNFLGNFKESSDQLFLEDYTPFTQLNLIPYFFKKRKYYFFYGSTGRTYELLRVLERIYITNGTENDQELKLIENIFIQVLQFQTSVLKKIIEIPESLIRKESEIYIPSEKYLREFNSFFELSENIVINTDYVQNLGDLNTFLPRSFEKVLQGIYFDKLYLKISEFEFSFILPQLQIEILFSIFREIVQKSTNKDLIKDKISNNLIYRLKDICGKFFRISGIIPNIVSPNNKKLSSDTEVIILFENYLLLFRLVELFSEKELSQEINNTYESLEEIVQNIQYEDHIYLSIGKGYYHNVPVRDIKIIKILIYESTDLTPNVIKFGFDTSLETIVFSLMDLIAMFEFLSSPLSFFKYLQERYTYLKKMFTINGINIFAAFLRNNESLPDYGEDRLFIDPHFWTVIYNNHLFSKFQDDIYELIELEFPNRFNVVKKWQDSQNLYECIDTLTLYSANLIKINGRLIWIFNPEFHPKLSFKGIEITMRVIGPVYADYIQRFIIAFEELLNSYTKFNLYGLYLVPVQICENNPKYERFQENLVTLDEQNPIVVKSFFNKYLKLISLIFYNFEFWGAKFANSLNNDNCKYAIKQFIYSIIELFEPNLSVESKLDKTDIFIDKHFIETRKDYYLTSIPTRNPRSDSYPSYQKLNSTDQKALIKEVEAYLRENQLKQEELTPQKSKELYNEIYLKLYNDLERLCSQYDESILYFAYKQLELIESKRYKTYIEAGMRSPDVLDKVYLDYFKKEIEEIAKLSSATRFIIENLLKFGIKGKKTINSINYGYVQALSLYLLLISQRSDFIHTKLMEFTIDIKEHYKFDEIQKHGIFNYTSFSEKEFQGKVEIARKTFNGAVSIADTDMEDTIELDANEIQLAKRLEQSFLKQFSFTFTNLSRVLFLLSSLELHSSNPMIFPLTKISEKHLVKELKENYIDIYNKHPAQSTNLDEIDEVEIKSILNYLSLDFTSYKNEDNLIHLKLLKKKERMTICPLIHLKSGEYLYGNECCNASFKLWRMYVLSGVFPYKIPDDSQVSIALQAIHSYHDKIFEDACGEIARATLGEEKYLIRLKNFKRISETLPKNPECGEIDLLVVNSSTKTIFILDAKNYFLKFNPNDIKNEIHRFLESDKSDLVKLVKKEQFVNENIDKFLDFFKIVKKEDWQIKKGFIVKYNFPSSHVSKESVDFIFLDELKDYLLGGISTTIM